MIKDFIETPLFGVIISIAAFETGLYINRKTKLSLLNPLLISILLVVTFLMKLDIPLEAYNKGGNLLSFFLGPATIILAVPLYKQFQLLKDNAIPIIIGITAGCAAAISSVLMLTNLFGLNGPIGISMIPKSITTPIGIEVSEQIGGIPAVTVTAIIITGIIGAVVAPVILKIFKITDAVAAGIAIGTSSHAIGTTKAVELGETQGAMSSLAIGVAGLITVLLAPLITNLL